MLYSKQRKLVFIHVSRTGGTAIARMLRNLAVDFKQILNQHSSIIEAKSLLGKDFTTYTSFAFVRNPWDRLVSWYALIGKTIADSSQSKDQLKDPSSEHWMQFDQFLDSWSNLEIQLGGKSRKELNQWGQLTDQEGKLLVNEIGRFETFEEDAQRIFTKINLTFKLQPRINESHHHHYSHYYSDYGRELVDHVFKEDIINFNYRFIKE